MIADLNGDGDQDVAVGTYAGLALLEGHTGASFENGLEWQFRMGAGWSLESAPAVGILDGTRQIVFAGFDTPNGTTRVAAFDVPGSTATVDAWPIVRHNAERTGVGPDVSCACFCDISNGTYSSEAVDWMVTEEITTGINAFQFGPDLLLDHAQMITFLWRQEGEPTGCADHGFIDVPGDSLYELAAAWAKAEGITRGTSLTTFSPAENVTRGQLVTLLWRRSGKPGGWPDPASATFLPANISPFRSRGRK